MFLLSGRVLLVHSLLPQELEIHHRLRGLLKRNASAKPSMLGWAAGGDAAPQRCCTMPSAMGDLTQPHPPDRVPHAPE